MSSVSVPQHGGILIYFYHSAKHSMLPWGILIFTLKLLQDSIWYVLSVLNNLVLFSLVIEEMDWNQQNGITCSFNSSRVHLLSVFQGHVPILLFSPSPITNTLFSDLFHIDKRFGQMLTFPPNLTFL